MPIVSIDHAGGMFRHRCPWCGYEDDLCIDPGRGHVSVHQPHPDRPPQTLVTRPCPHCATHTVGPHGEPVEGSVECFRLNIPSWEAGEGPHPGSLLGTTMTGPNGITNVCSEHVVGYHLGTDHVQQKRLVRALQQHPHLARHAPLLPDPPHLPGHPTQRWDGQWRPPLDHDRADHKP